MDGTFTQCSASTVKTESLFSLFFSYVVPFHVIESNYTHIYVYVYMESQSKSKSSLTTTAVSTWKRLPQDFDRKFIRKSNLWILDLDYFLTSLIIKKKWNVSRIMNIPPSPLNFLKWGFHDIWWQIIILVHRDTLNSCIIFLGNNLESILKLKLKLIIKEKDSHHLLFPIIYWCT